jgi:hypothetical protein
MPPLNPAPACIKVQLVGTNQGALWMNNLHFQTEAQVGVPQGTTQIDTFLTGIATAWGAQIAPLCNTQVSLTALVYTDLSSTTGVQYTATLPTPIAGTRAGTTLPCSVAMVISLRVANRYRGGHGRIYVPAAVQADITSGRTWSGTFNTLATNNAATFRTTLEGMSVGTVQVNLIVLSYFSGSHKTPTDPHPLPVPRATPLAMRVTSARVRTRVDTQRRRLGKETV